MGARRVAITIDSTTADIRLARDFASDVAVKLFPGVDGEALRLMVSEIVSNAVYLEAGPIELSFKYVAPDLLRVEVRDDGWGQPEVSDEVGHISGHGLRIVESLSIEWGVDQFLPGKIVWFALPGVDVTPKN